MRQTSHLTEPDVAAALDPGSSPETARARAQALAHARACDACRALVEAARADERDAAHWLEALDHPAPVVDPRAVLSRATHPSRALRFARARRTARIARLPLWTAGALLAGVTAAAAAVLPTSPLRHFMERMTHAGTRSPMAPASVHPMRAAAPAQALRGVAIVPAGDATITFESPQRRGSVRISSGSAAALTVEADADGPTYTVGADAIVVHNRATDTVGYHVLVPERGALRLIVAGRRAYEQRAGTADDSSGRLRSPDAVVSLQRREAPGH